MKRGIFVHKTIIKYFYFMEKTRKKSVENCETA